MDDPQFRLPQIYDPTPTPTPTPVSRWKRLTGPLIAVLLIGAKFFGQIKFFILPALKFFPALLKTGGSMIFMIWIYSMMFGWMYAGGFVLLILVHECGHLIAARWCGLKVGLPVFIPFMGAVIALKEAPRNAWIEAIVGIGGPIAGTIGAIVCHSVFIATQNPLWLALAYTGYFLNLFNLMPVGFLDGGRIVNAISPWLLLPGLALLVWFMYEHGPNFLLVLILILALPKVWRLFWSRTPEEQMYYELAPAKRLTMGLSFFGLAALLFYQMQNTIAELSSLGHWRN
ncbi:MAG: site-2 protease family protein [Prosthecobacter sp.]|nr:site-2 protease family protein [Prosthecobacter sp.]